MFFFFFFSFPFVLGGALGIFQCIHRRFNTGSYGSFLSLFSVVLTLFYTSGFGVVSKVLHHTNFSAPFRQRSRLDNMRIIRSVLRSWYFQLIQYNLRLFPFDLSTY